MTLNCAAHVAACQADTAGSRMIFDSLLRKKNVIIAIDGCCPDNGERREMGYEIGVGLRERLRSNIEDIRSYGAHVTVAENLYRKTMMAIMGEDDAPRISGITKQLVIRLIMHLVLNVTKQLVIRLIMHLVLNVTKQLVIR